MSDKTYQVIDYKLLTSNVAQLFLELRSSAPLQYAAGQYIKIIHPDQSTSPFSIANAPHTTGLLELHLLFLKENRKSWDIFQQAKAQQPFILRGPYGQCTLAHMAEKKPMIFIARSTGFSPVKAIVEALSQHDVYPPIHFYWSAPGWRDLYLRERVNEWVKKLRNFHFTAVLTREIVPAEEDVKYGSVAEVVLQDYPDLSAHQVYVSGPQRMVYSALAAFQQSGLPRDSFYSDVFDYQP